MCAINTVKCISLFVCSKKSCTEKKNDLRTQLKKKRKIIKNKIRIEFNSKNKYWRCKKYIAIIKIKSALTSTGSQPHQPPQFNSCCAQSDPKTIAKTIINKKLLYDLKKTVSEKYKLNKEEELTKRK